jgi:organic hydroperoxide reductase OsmC/OhrA
MKISAVVNNRPDGHTVQVYTGTHSQTLAIPAARDGRGSGVNGGELLMAALATCFCNDVYREADKLGLQVDGVEVEAVGEFPGPGLAATGICYRVRISSPGSADEIAALLHGTDAVAEVHNTLRSGIRVQLLD